MTDKPTPQTAKVARNQLRQAAENVVTTLSNDSAAQYESVLVTGVGWQNARGVWIDTGGTYVDTKGGQMISAAVVVGQVLAHGTADAAVGDLEAAARVAQTFNRCKGSEVLVDEGSVDTQGLRAGQEFACPVGGHEAAMVADGDRLFYVAHDVQGRPLD